MGVDVYVDVDVKVRVGGIKIESGRNGGAWGMR